MYYGQKKSPIVIVDAYSSGRYLIPSFHAAGYPCIHIKSGFVPAGFQRHYELALAKSDRHFAFEEYDNNVDSLADQLAPLNVKCILAGSEGGVELADQLNTKLDLEFAHSSQNASARRDKFLMQDALFHAGITSIKQQLVKTGDELAQWCTDHGFFPIVLKPLKSCGTDGVFVCHNKAEAEDAFYNLRGRRDFFDQENRAVLCQEFIRGIEFEVNGVACRNVPFITGVWRSNKRLRHSYPVYDNIRLVAPHDASYNILTDYVCDVCRVLGINNGAFHAEVMMTDRGPVLIEVAARLGGGYDPYIDHECLGYSQTSKLVQACLNPDQFIRDSMTPAQNTRQFEVAYVFMIAEQAGLVSALPDDSFSLLPGFVGLEYYRNIGEIQRETKDLITSPGELVLMHEDKNCIEHSIAAFRSLEADFYTKAIKFDITNAFLSNPADV